MKFNQLQLFAAEIGTSAKASISKRSRGTVRRKQSGTTMEQLQLDLGVPDCQVEPEHARNVGITDGKAVSMDCSGVPATLSFDRGGMALVEYQEVGHEV